MSAESRTDESCKVQRQLSGRRHDTFEYLSYQMIRNRNKMKNRNCDKTGIVHDRPGLGTQAEF